MSFDSNSTPASAPAQSPLRSVVVYGHKGLIGSALLRRLERNRGLAPIQTLDWPEAQERMPNLDPQNGTDLVFAGGLTNANLAVDELENANLTVPCKVIEATRAEDVRYITLGTIQENFPELCEGNPYLNSKLKLGRYMSTLPVGKALHLRLHTVYGNPPKAHMFYGLMANAILNNEEFSMSAGRQMREYHHVDDIAGCLEALLNHQWSFGPLASVNSGEPTRLVELASAVFGIFGKENLLKVGELATPVGENEAKAFARTPEWMLPVSREPIKGVADEIQSWIQKETG